MQKTLEQYDLLTKDCRNLFEKKTRDYGTSWRILRTTSLTDQLYIKAKRIRSIEEKGAQKISDSVEEDYVGLINYSLISLIQLNLTDVDDLELPLEEVLAKYDEQLSVTRGLMIDKNHDYGEVWREMRVTSLTDLILMKLLRIKQIEDNQGKNYSFGRFRCKLSGYYKLFRLCFNKTAGNIRLIALIFL